jgi:solute carrier family 25, member 43
MGKKQDRRLTFWQNFIAGGIAGVCSRTFTSPLDVVKIISQVGSKQHKGFFGSFANIYRQEGLRGFWKGNLVACIRLFPYSAINFACFNELKNVWTNPETGKMSNFSSLAAGAISGCVATCIVYPLDMVKTRLTVQVNGSNKYKGIIDAFKVIYKEEGILAFYKGLSASILGVIPFGGLQFMSYEILAYVWGKPRSQLNGMENFINGCLAGSIAQTISFPFDTIRKKMQAQNKKAVTSDVDIEFNGLWDCIVKTVKSNGVIGLWRGTLANLAKVAPYAGLMFFFNELCKNYYYFSNGYHSTPWKGVPAEGVNMDWSIEEARAYKKEHKEYYHWK